MISMHGKKICQSEIDDNTKLRGSNFSEREKKELENTMIAFKVYEKSVENLCIPNANVLFQK